MTAELADLSQCPDRAERALALAVGHGEQDQSAQALDALEQALHWGIDRQQLSQHLLSGAFGDLSRAMAFHAPVSYQLGTQQRQAADSLAIIRRSLATDPAARARHRTAGCRTATGAPKARAIVPEPSASQLALFHCRVQLDDQTHWLAFNPAAPEHYRLEGNLLHFQLPPGKPGYLVSNETGDFNIAPSVNPLPLAPDTAYEISGQIACDACEEAPMVWLFDYVDGKKRDGTSFRTQNGAFQAYIRTQGASAQFAVGIRLAGAGRLTLSETRIHLISGPIPTLAASLEHKITERLSEVRSKIDTEQQRRSRNTLAQLEDFVRLQTFMGPDIILPTMHGWPVSPDVGLLLIKQIAAQHYQAVIEFGSGVSTLIIARALQRTVATHKRAPSVFLSLEHLEQYHAETLEHLAAAGLQDQVNLALAPLVPYQAANGQEYPYYDLQQPLHTLSRQLTSDARILALIDGPPGATRSQARYPALPVLLDQLPPIGQLDLLMDDYIRDDERAIVQQWETLAQERGLACTRTEYLNFEKQACLLSIDLSPA